MSATYTIGTLATLTGLSQHTIRAWERRHQAMSPGRTESNRRIYLDEDLERLVALKRIVDSGHSIGQVARLTTPQLLNLASSHERPNPSVDANLRGEGSERYLHACMQALFRLDPSALEDGLTRGTAAMGIIRLLDEVVIPFLGEIESRWVMGSLRISQEHMATAVLRSYLDRVRTSMPGLPNSPRLLITTPRNQHHEIGSLMAGIVAATEFWNVTYLGSNLPAKEIADAAQMSESSAIGLSLVYPLDDPALAGELRLLRSLIGGRLPILVGGRAVHAYSEVLEEIGSQRCPDFSTLREALRRIENESDFA